MADFLVLEEDGTSHLLTETGDSLLLEESSPQQRSASFTADAQFEASADVVPVGSDATWRVGSITVPSATGTQAVTGLGGMPKAVFFYGTNWTTEDTAVTTTGAGVFRGMAAPKWDDPGTIVRNAATVVPTGDAHGNDNASILMLDTSGTNTYLYAADVVSFDADGFTLNWDPAAAGGYKIVWVALMDVAEVGGYVGTATTLTLGWKAGASLLHGAWGGPAVSGSDRTQEYWGGGAYPGTFAPTWFAAGLTAFSFPTSAFAQYNVRLQNDNPAISVAQGGTFVGPFLSAQNVLAYPSGAGLEDLVVNFTGGNGGMIVAWDDEDSQTGRVSTPAQNQGDTVTVSGLPFEPGLVIGYTLSNEPDGQGSSDPFGARGAVGFSVATPDFQWCALVDGVDDRGSFQSFQRGFVDTVDGTDVHAGTVELTQDGFVMTTEEDTTTAHDWVWHAFGHPDPGHEVDPPHLPPDPRLTDVERTIPAVKKPLEKPPPVPEGDDQAARKGIKDVDTVTRVDFEDAPELEGDEDYEDEPDA